METSDVESDDEEEFQNEEDFKALEVQHYQSLIHMNFSNLFPNLKYFDEKQNTKKGQYDTQEIGIMDFLTIDEEENTFVVIELKRSTSDKTIGQILRYMGWVKQNLSKNNQKVKGLIVGVSKDNKFDYALSMTSNIVFKTMKLNITIS